MRIKSYFAKSVDEAMVQAREELGADALLLNTRKTIPEAGQPAGYEVVFGIAEQEVAEPVRPELVQPEMVQPEPAAQEPVPQPESHPAPDDLTGELGKLHARMDELRSLIERTSKNYLNGRILPELAEIYARLLSADVDPLLGQEIIDRVEASMPADDFPRTGRTIRVDLDRLEALVRAELERRVIVDPKLAEVVTLVGPTGAGKTTSLMKLAAIAVNAGRLVRILSLDTGRLAPQMQLPYFASNQGMAFATVPSIEALPAIVEEARKKELVLIDTPGYAGNDDQGVETTAHAIASCPGVDVHLVVPGYMKASDLRRTIRRYEAFRPSKLLVTKLDETQTFGSIYSGAAWAGLSLSFMAHGPAVPDDLHQASLEDFVAMIVDREAALDQRVA